MKTPFLIIGGGVAGLSAANHLAENGADVTLLEAGSYPSHKICGEFLSPEALPLLEKWNIKTTANIQKMRLITQNKQWSMLFPKKGGTILRSTLDTALAKRASQKGAQIETGVRVEHIEIPKNQENPFILSLTNGQTWQAKTLLLSTGRLLGSILKSPPPKLCYIGVKAHFEGPSLQEELILHLLPKAYFGVAPIGKNRLNIAGLIACTEKEAKSPQAFFSSFLKTIKSSPFCQFLKETTCLFEDWMIGAIPEFGIRPFPNWPNTFFLGDAAGVIPPATGNGLAMGLTSGLLAAHFALKQNPQAYLKQWKREYKGRIFRGKILHQLFLSSTLAPVIPIINQLFPFLPNYFFSSTRGTEPFEFESFESSC